MNRIGLPPSHVGRLRILPEADRSVIGTVELGLLFVMAWWSGPSRQGFRRLKQVLAAVDPGGTLELVVVDTDGSPDLEGVPELAGRLHGWGEVAWIRSGRIVATSGMGYHPECFEENTRRLLEGKDASRTAAIPATAPVYRGQFR